MVDERVASTSPSPDFRVFLSYSRADHGVAAQLADELRQKGIDVWQDSEIPLGSSVLTAIRSSIRQADAVIVLVSPAAGDSPWVDLEIASAVAARADDPSKLIIPVLTDGAEPPPLLMDSQGIRLTASTDVRHLAARVAHELVGRSTDVERRPGDALDVLQAYRNYLEYKREAEHYDNDIRRESLIRSLGIVLAFLSLVAGITTSSVAAFSGQGLVAATFALIMIALPLSIIRLSSPSMTSARRSLHKESER